jgi:hypothetical protein
MKIYMNFTSDSGIDAYDYGKDWIWVQFKNGMVYEYTSAAAGAQNIEAMKSRALLGNGLMAFIDTHAETLHARRLR